MERRRDPRYKSNMEPPSHHYNDRYGSQYDNYDYEEDYGNQYANSDPHMHHRGHHLHHHSHEEEDDHWTNQNSRDQQQDFYDTVPATNVLPLPIKTNPKNAINIARVQIAAGDRERERERERERDRERESDNSSSSIPQAPPPPRFGPTDRYDTKSKYGNSSMAMGIQSEKQADVHIRFEPTGKREFQHQHKPTSFIDGFRSGEVPVMTKKKDGGGGGQTANAIRSIINNLKGGNETKIESDSIPRNRVSTNPFVRANQQMQIQAQNQQQNSNQNQSRFEMSQPKNPSKNVAEVVEKMNSGDWPIRIEDEEASQVHQKNSAAAERRSYSSQHMEKEKEKAKQWETLHRKKDEKRSILEDKPDFQIIQNHPQNQNIIQKQQIREENDKMSDKSHEEENTTVSTDSALCSEETRGISPYKLPFDGSRPIDDDQLTEESEKLLFYFKSHREVLNYLGIGLSERLWKHMDNLPTFDASIKIFKTQNSSLTESEGQKLSNLKVAQVQPSNIPQPPKISITPSFHQDRKSPINRELLHQHSLQQQQQQQQLRSPVRTGSQNEERSPAQIPSQDESRYLKNNEHFQNSSNRERVLNAAGGRFVKKSAAALIAKKQGMAIEDPNSATEIIDPRIAEEIRNLRDREEELKRSRSEMAISTSPVSPDADINGIHTTVTTKQSIRNAQSYEQLDNPHPTNGRIRNNGQESHRSPIERSHSSHNIYIENDAHLPRHNTHSYSDMNYGSMPRAHTHSRQENQYGHTSDYRSQQDGGYRHPRKSEFFRTPANSEAAHANRPKSIAAFETKSSSFNRSGLQLPPAGVSLSSSARILLLRQKRWKMKKKSSNTRSRKESLLKKGDRSKTGLKNTQSNKKESKKTIEKTAPSTISYEAKEKPQGATPSVPKKDKDATRSEKRKPDAKKKEVKKEEPKKEVKKEEEKEKKPTTPPVEEKKPEERPEVKGKESMSGMESATVNEKQTQAKMDDGYEDFGPGAKN